MSKRKLQHAYSLGKKKKKATSSIVINALWWGNLVKFTVPKERQLKIK